MRMNLQSTKIELINWLTTLEDEKIIDKLVELKTDYDWWNTISLDEKKTIEKGLIDSNKGKVVSHKDAQKVYEKWL